jgi:hypothetical protein
MTTYVEDVNKHHTSTVKSNNIELSMKHDSNKCKSLLKAIGGQLVPEKCNYYITKWTFQTNGKPKLELSKAKHKKGSISEVNNLIQTLQRLLGINISQENQVMTQQNQWVEKEKHTLNISNTKNELQRSGSYL